MKHGISMFLFVPLLSMRPTSARTVCRALVVHSDVAEQVSHRLSVVNAADSLSQYHANVHSLYFGAL